MADEWTPLTDSLRSLLTAQGWADPTPVAVAVSGGADSMALLLTACALGLDVTVLHVDHGLRPESSADRDFVEHAARDLGCAFHAHLAHNLAAKAERDGQGLEAAARTERYSWFDQKVGPGGILLTGHHADDQRETQLLHLIRGTRPDAWRGMEPWNTERGFAIGRPFLGLTREALLNALRQKGQAWREDASNLDPRHLRNRIRHELVPLLDVLRPGWDAGLSRAAALAVEWRTSTLDLLADVKPGELPLSLVKAAPSPRHLVWLWGAQFGAVAGQLDALISLAEPSTETGKQCSTSSHRILRERDRLLAMPLAPSDAPLNWPQPLNPHTDKKGEIHTPQGTLKWSVSHVNERPEVVRNEKTAQLDLSTFKGPLTLRHWLSGDRIAPLGMEGQQSVSDILTQRKVPHASRSQVLLLEDAEQYPVWLVGHRIDRRVALPETVSARGIDVLNLHWFPA